jgi:hypothetical protein
MLTVFSHSDGFNWGYGRSGPRQAALAILCDAVGPHLAMRLYSTFVNAFVSQRPLRTSPLKYRSEG